MSDIREQRRITGERLENLDKASREEWSIAASEALIQSVGGSAVIAIAAGGFSEFLRVSKPVYDGHGFKFDDYRRMFDRINLAAERLKQGNGLGRIEKRLGLAAKIKHFLRRG